MVCAAVWRAMVCSRGRKLSTLSARGHGARTCVSRHGQNPSSPACATACGKRWQPACGAHPYAPARPSHPSITQLTLREEEGWGLRAMKEAAHAARVQRRSHALECVE